MGREENANNEWEWSLFGGTKATGCEVAKLHQTASNSPNKRKALRSASKERVLGRIRSIQHRKWRPLLFLPYSFISYFHILFIFIFYWILLHYVFILLYSSKASEASFWYWICEWEVNVVNNLWDGWTNLGETFRDCIGWVWEWPRERILWKSWNTKKFKFL